MTIELLDTLDSRPSEIISKINEIISVLNKIESLAADLKKTIDEATSEKDSG